MDPYGRLVSNNLMQMPKWDSGIKFAAPNRPAQSANSYDNWKKNIVKNSQPNTSILKKQVTFKNIAAPMNCRETATNLPDSYKEFSGTPLMNRNRHFEKIYMANIPHRSLDLSIIELPNLIATPQESQNSEGEHEQVEKQPEKIPTTYKEFLEWQQCRNETCNGNNSERKIIEADRIITDIFNYNSPKGTYENQVVSRNKNSSDKISKKRPEVKNLQYLDKTERQVDRALRKTEKCLPIPQCDIFSAGKEKVNDTLYDSFQSILNEEECVLDHHMNKRKSNPGWGCDPINKCVPINKAQIQNNFSLIDHNWDVKTRNTSCDADQQNKKTHLNDSESQTSLVYCPPNNTQSGEIVRADEITVKDLLKIIQQQNEQLLLLQKQIANLLERKESPKQIEESHPKQYTNHNKVLTNGEQVKILNSPGGTPRKGPLSKFSIDLMTSFEVSIRPQQNIFQRKQRDLINNEAKIQEIIENDSTDSNLDKKCQKEMVDSSLRLEEPLNIRESTPSPEPSIKIDMKEYESSDDDDEDMTSKIGATFYKEMMRQVNIIIQKAQNQTSSSIHKNKTDDWDEETLNRTRDAIKHMRKLAKNFSTIDEVPSSDDGSDGDKDSPDHVSFAVRQLLMKYLPHEQLARLKETQQKCSQKKNTQDKIIFTSRTPEFSLATVEFMKKYNLIASNSNVPQKPFKNTTTHQKPNLHTKAINSNMLKKLNGNNPKILDISVLKQQPKLL